MWKDIKGWEGFYEVSDSGDVRNKLTQHIISQESNTAGYYRVRLYNKNHNPSVQRFFVHRLVAEAFIPNVNNLLEVNHKDHDISHNYLSNLEWTSRIDNELDSRMYGSKLYRPFKVEYQNGDITIFDTKPMLARLLNVSRHLISLWLRGISCSYKNYGISKLYYI